MFRVGRLGSAVLRPWLLQHRAQTSFSTAEPFLSGTSASYMEAMFENWERDRNSVHKSWDQFFTAASKGAAPGQAYQAPPTLGHVTLPPVSSPLVDRQQLREIHALIRGYQTKGHNVATLDPLGISVDRPYPPEVDLQNTRYRNLDMDTDTEIEVPKTTKVGGDKSKLSVKEIRKRLQETYCGNIGVEFMYIDDRDKRDWIKERFEPPGVRKITNDERTILLTRLVQSSTFEKFLKQQYPSEKRFGLEGCEVLIPAMKSIIEQSIRNGVDSFVIGMPHRGRLNVLANVAKKPLEDIFYRFDPSEEGSGDVKYHLGMFIKRFNPHIGKDIQIAVVANPSHLEAVDPVVQGETRAEQFYRGDEEGNQVMSILLHGDAAFAGQGVVYETFHLSDLKDYTTHGTIHIVVNNQIGFTTDPRVARNAPYMSSPYCTDIAKVVEAPIFHVNADDPEAVMHVCQVASEWRYKYHNDVVIDLVCYRRHGHSELDEPMSTQPHMYREIEKHIPVVESYAKKLEKQKIVSDELYQNEKKKYKEKYETAYQKSKAEVRTQNENWLDSPWEDFFNKDGKSDSIPPTGVAMEQLRHIGEVFSSVPDDFNTHNKVLDRVLEGRKKMLTNQEADWAMGEAFAFGTLLQDGYHVRLSGQDVERGTFAHRHHVIHDQEVKKKKYLPLEHLSHDQAKYTVCNSSLSEFAVLGFELGFSISNPRALVCWEAQFGDFHNNAQCIIDQFISSGQDKWARQSGLVLLLPHGYEGKGPEHSSARLERFLQLCKDDPDELPSGDDFNQLVDCNLQVVNCSTPANYFHVLCRQMRAPFRKPLVIMTPKSLLRLSEAKSPFSDMAEGTAFQRMISDEVCQGGEAVKRIVFCSGKIYYELLKERETQGKTDSVAILRMEQISPFPYDLVQQALRLYPSADIVWSQEEPKNMGAWSYAQPRLATASRHDKREIRYVGRSPSASVATGSKSTHIKEQADVCANTFDIQ